MYQNRIRFAQITAQLVLFMILSPAFEACLAAESNSVDGQHLYQVVCTQCHGLVPIEQTRDGRSGWEDTVHKMVIVGAELNVEEMEVLVDYLAAEFGPGAGPMTTGMLPPNAALPGAGGISSKDIVLPEGDGKQLVQAYCVMCHDLGRIVSTQRDREDWPHYVRNMLAQNEMALDETEVNTMVAYLQRHFSK